MHIGDGCVIKAIVADRDGCVTEVIVADMTILGATMSQHSPPSALLQWPRSCGSGTDYNCFLGAYQRSLRVTGAIVADTVVLGAMTFNSSLHHHAGQL